MTGRRLILKDQTTFENGEAGYAQGFLWLYLPGCTIAEAALVFTDPEKTDVILFQYGEMEDRYEHFTDCRSILTDGDRISVCMEKEGE